MGVINKILFWLNSLYGSLFIKRTSRSMNTDLLQISLNYKRLVWVLVVASILLLLTFSLVIAVPGNQSVVAAPVAGTVLKTEAGRFPAAGQLLTKGQPIMRLMLLPPEKDLLSAKEDAVVKREQLELAQSKADRAEKLLNTRAISEKAFEETHLCHC